MPALLSGVVLVVMAETVIDQPRLALRSQRRLQPRRHTESAQQRRGATCRRQRHAAAATVRRRLHHTATTRSVAQIEIAR